MPLDISNKALNINIMDQLSKPAYLSDIPRYYDNQEISQSYSCNTLVNKIILSKG